MWMTLVSEGNSNNYLPLQCLRAISTLYEEKCSLIQPSISLPYTWYGVISYPWSPCLQYAQAYSCHILHQENLVKVKQVQVLVRSVKLNCISGQVRLTMCNHETENNLGQPKVNVSRPLRVRLHYNVSPAQTKAQALTPLTSTYKSQTQTQGLRTPQWWRAWSRVQSDLEFKPYCFAAWIQQ